jgi:hypothetical protein
VQFDGGAAAASSARESNQDVIYFNARLVLFIPFVSPNTQDSVSSVIETHMRFFFSRISFGPSKKKKQIKLVA